MPRVSRSREAARAEALRRETERRERSTALAQSRSAAAERDEVVHMMACDEPERTHVVYLPETESGWCLSSRSLSLVSCEVLKFLLYMRGSLPHLYDAVAEAHYEAAKEWTARRSRRGVDAPRAPQAPRPSSKVARFLQRADQVLGCLSEPNLFLGRAEGSDFEVLFVFGPSVRRPREAYLIRAQARAAGEEEPAVDRAARGLLTRVNRKLVTAIMEAEESRRGGGPSAGGRRGGALQRERNKGLGSNPKAHVLVRRREPAPIGAGFDGFFPQPGVDAEAMDPVVVELRLKSAEGGENASEGWGPWYQCSTVLGGIK